MAKKDIRKSKFKSIAGWRGDSLCCPQAFGGDVFAGCSVGCFFCFCRETEAEMYQKYYTGWSRSLVRECDPEDYSRLFEKAFGNDKPTKDWTVRCLRHGLPFNMGSKSETFQYPNHPTVIRVLEIFREAGVPVIFETKTDLIGLESYLDIVCELNCAVIISIMGGGDELNQKLEPNAPTVSRRWQLVAELNRRNIWCGVRWEPIMPGINSKDAQFEGYAANAKESGAQHVSLYNYRSSDYGTAQKKFENRDFDYLKMLEGNLDENWRPIGKRFFDILRTAEVPASSPDFVNFPFDSDCISCCGTDDVFKVLYKFNLQWACHLIKTNGQVTWDDMEAVEFRHPKAYENLKAHWNGGGGFFTLADSPEVSIIDQDNNGRNVYAKAEGNKVRKLKGLGLIV